MMLFFVENKLLLGVVGIVLLFVVVGFVVSWGFYCKKFLDVFFKVYFEYSLVVKYVFEYGICELLLFMKFRQVNNLYYFKLVINSFDFISYIRYLVCIFKFYIYLLQDYWYVVFL